MHSTGLLASAEWSAVSSQRPAPLPRYPGLLPRRSALHPRRLPPFSTLPTPCVADRSPCGGTPDNTNPGCHLVRDVCSRPGHVPPRRQCRSTGSLHSSRHCLPWIAASDARRGSSCPAMVAPLVCSPLLWAARGSITRNPAAFAPAVVVALSSSVRAHNDQPGSVLYSRPAAAKRPPTAPRFWFRQLLLPIRFSITPRSTIIANSSLP